MLEGIKVHGSYLLPLNHYSYRKKTDFIAIHCSADPEEDGINDTTEDIREEHVKQGWMDIGYHFVIERDGSIHYGRPALAVGSGVRGYNHNSLHICMVGGADKRGRGENDFTAAQWDSLKVVVRAATEAYKGAVVQGHRDFPGVKKDCPSFDAKAWWKEANK